jgi:hypothetical protein
MKLPAAKLPGHLMIPCALRLQLECLVPIVAELRSITIKIKPLLHTTEGVIEKFPHLLRSKNEHYKKSS